jgi:hypothetical protein
MSAPLPVQNAAQRVVRFTRSRLAKKGALYGPQRFKRLGYFRLYSALCASPLACARGRPKGSLTTPRVVDRHRRVVERRANSLKETL